MLYATLLKREPKDLRVFHTEEDAQTDYDQIARAYDPTHEEGADSEVVEFLILATVLIR